MMDPYYDQGGITIYHGDCREVLPGLEPAVFGFADPPYGVGFDYGKNHEDSAGVDYESMIHEAFTLLGAVSDVTCWTTGMRHMWRYPEPQWILGWFKPGSTRQNGLGGFNVWEPILVYGKPESRVYQDAIRLPDAANHASGPASEHPCPKPLKLIEWLIGEFTSPGDLVVDPFMGSGTTLHAAKLLGREAIGIDVSEEYCDIAVRRLAQGVLPLDLDVPHPMDGQEVLL